MHAAYIEATGAPEVIRYGELPKPVPKDGEVLAKVGAVAVNRLTRTSVPESSRCRCQSRSLSAATWRARSKPSAPGVKRFKAGDRVWGIEPGFAWPAGHVAEYAAVHEDWLYPRQMVSPIRRSRPSPSSASLHILACSAAPSCSPARPLLSSTAAPARRLPGGANGQGGRRQGHHDRRSAEKAELCKSWGADGVINYKTEDVPARIQEFTAGKGVQVWFETQATGLHEDRAADGAMGPHRHHGRPPSAADVSGRPVLRESPVAVSASRCSMSRPPTSGNVPMTSIVR